MTASSTRPGPAPRAPRTTQAHDHAQAHDHTQPHGHAPGHPQAHDHTDAPGAPTPCAPSYHRLTALAPMLDLHCAPPRHGDGWLPVDALTSDPEALRELVAHDARQGLTRYGRPLRPDVAAGFGLHRFVWPVSLLFTVPWFLERRVPLLGPGDVSVHRAPASMELTVRPEAFVCLPDDPAVRAAGARTVPDEDALAAELRRALGEFLTPVLAAFGPQARRGPRVLWAMATDAVVEGLWYAGGLLGEQERARAELSALLAPGEPAGAGAPAGPGEPDGPAAPPARSSPGPARTPGADRGPAPAPAPFTPGAGFAPPAPGCTGASGTDRARASCCLVYTVESAEMCNGCPRVTRR
ncbi:(2Fe-2S)-binding protein [Kitasatospora sp. NPDC098652]|uniref:(2Fe-2S)-binding protein n=1 Tax=Kitasatospora sp. NPDC098652 TaxID=3364095 RepID=UPI00380B0995